MQKRNLFLASGTLVLLFVGLIYAWSVFIRPLEMKFGWDRSQTSHIFTFSMSFFCIGGILGGYLIRSKSAAFIIRCSAVLMSIGFLFCAYTSSLLGIYFFYGVVCSLGVGFVYNAVLSTIVRWFPDKASLCSGILLMGFGAGGFLLSNLAGTVINNLGVDIAFIVFAVICIVILGVASFAIFDPKEEDVSGLVKKVAQPTDDVQTKDMIKKPSFWIVFFWGMFSSACALAIIGQGSPFAETVGMVQRTAAFAVGVIAVSNGIGRVIMGLIYSRIPNKYLMLFISALFLIASGILLLALKTENPLFIYPGYVLVGYAYGSVPSFGVSIVRERFGTKFYSLNMSVFNTHLIFSALIGSSLAGQIFGMTNNYMNVLLLIAVSSILAIASAFTLKMQKQ